MCRTPPHSSGILRRSPAGRASVKKRDPVIKVAFLQVVQSRFDVVAEWLCETRRGGDLNRASVVRLRANAAHQT
jgi:hypothetical protein